MNDARNISRWSTPLVLGCALVCLGIGYAAARWRAPAPVVSQAKVSAATAVHDGAAPAAAAPAVAWDARWREQGARPACPSVTRDRAALLEELARTDPQRALKLALAEPNWLVREQLRNAALRGWGATAPDDAMKWAMDQAVTGERMRCVSAVLTGAAENPEAAARIARTACDADPQQAGDYGHSLINALVERTGDFKSAAEFARKADNVDRQSFLVDSAYYQWAQHDPQQAFKELASITDPAARDAAMKGVVEGCADADAHHLADYAKALPEGEDRSRILAVALPEWVGKDPDAALDWINEAGPHPDYDRGLAALTRLSSLESHPAMAMELTDSICDPVQRSLTKSDFFLRWARQDYDAAAQYARSLQNPEYWEMFMTDLATAAAGRSQ